MWSILHHMDLPDPSRRPPADESHDPTARRRRPAAVTDSITAADDVDTRITELSHELSSLIDGSLRFVHLAHRSLSLGSDPAGANAARQLERARSGLTRMAGLLARAMQPGIPNLFLADDEPLIDALTLAVDMVRPVAFAKNIEIHLEIAPHLVLTPAGPAYTILSNALRNAVEATDGPGRIDVTASLEPGDDGTHAVCLRVEDDGSGPLDGATVFEFGYTTKPGGLGVGLAMVRELLEELYGTVSFSKNPPSKPGWRPSRPGGCFTARWPVGPIA